MRSGDEIIVPGHPRWPEFVSRLSRARFCFGTTEQARSTLASMGDVDAEGSLREHAIQIQNPPVTVSLGVSDEGPSRKAAASISIAVELLREFLDQFLPAAAGTRASWQGLQGLAGEAQVFEVGSAGSTFDHVFLEAGLKGRWEASVDGISHEVDCFLTVHVLLPWRRDRTEEDSELPPVALVAPAPDRTCLSAPSRRYWSRARRTRARPRCSSTR